MTQTVPSSRRRFFALLAAPAIVRATSLMPIKSFSYLDRVRAEYDPVEAIESDPEQFQRMSYLREIFLSIVASEFRIPVRYLR